MEKICGDEVKITPSILRFQQLDEMVFLQQVAKVTKKKKQLGVQIKTR